MSKILAFVDEYLKDPNCRPVDWRVSHMTNQEHDIFVELVNEKTNTQDIPNYKEYIDAMWNPNIIEPSTAIKEKSIEDAQVVEKTPAEKMEEIIKNNDKFETVRVIMNILIKELELPETASIGQIVHELNKVSEKYYASMEEWKKMTKTPIK